MSGGKTGACGDENSTQRKCTKGGQPFSFGFLEESGYFHVCLLTFGRGALTL